MGDGKWTRNEIRAWLVDFAYPLVNRITEQSDELVSALEPFAEKYRSQLKFTFFVKLQATDSLCKTYGVMSNDELLLIERPLEMKREHGHSNRPRPPMYRLEQVTHARIVEFFQQYETGTLRRYF